MESITSSIKRFVFLICMVFYIISCTGYNLKGVRAYSRSIEESKKRKFYKNTYKFTDKNFDLYRGDSLYSNSIFVEKGFGYGNSRNEIQESFYGFEGGEYQIVIPLSEKLIEFYSENLYFFKIYNTDEYCEIRDYCLLFSIDSTMIRDTISIIVNKESAVDSIGFFRIVKVE